MHGKSTEVDGRFLGHRKLVEVPTEYENLKEVEGRSRWPHGKLIEVNGKSCGWTECFRKLMEGPTDAQKVDNNSTDTWKVDGSRQKVVAQKVDRRSCGHTQCLQKVPRMRRKLTKVPQPQGRLSKVLRTHGKLTEGLVAAQKVDVC